MFPRTPWLLLPLALAGCDSTGPGDESLEVSQFTPADGATDVPVGTAVTIKLAGDVNPASLARSVTIAAGADTLPAALDYDLDMRTLTLSAPFLPATAYRVSVGSDTTWSFTTGGWHTAKVDDVQLFGEAGWGGPALANSASGRHVAYGSTAEVHYGGCLSACGLAGAWSPVGLGIGGRAGFEPSMVVDGTGGLHLLYGAGGTVGGWLGYSVCAAACTDSASWTTVFVVQEREIVSSSLGVGADGAVHVAFQDSAQGGVTYGHCSSDCIQVGNWTLQPITSGIVAMEPSLALGPGGEVHVSYSDFTGQHLSYATCTDHCTTAASWTTVAVNPESGAGRSPSIVAGPDGTLRISWYDESARDLRFAVCRESCTSSSGWLGMAVETDGDVGREPSLAVDAQGRAHVAYYDFQRGALRYATCSTTCESQAAWRTVEADGDGDVGRSPALTVDAQGRIVIAYMDYTTGNPYPLKVLE
jgi:hypothetical protein